MSWFTKITGIDRVVSRKVNEEMTKRLYINVKGDLSGNGTDMSYRQREYKVWSLGSADAILEFYKSSGSNGQNAYEQSTGRNLFWNWVGGTEVPKVHFPAAEAMLNQMKALLFNAGIEMQVIKKNGEEVLERETQEITKRNNDVWDDNNQFELLQKGSDYATYSGGLGLKTIIDTTISKKPIIEIYPSERIKFRTKYGRVTEIIFLDYYNDVKFKDDKKIVTLNSIYGIGYIDYKMYDDKGKEVSLDRGGEETKNLQKLVLMKDGKPLDFLLATYIRNRTTSAEFKETPYGGSDFEGVIDTFHLIDEQYSLLNNYSRASRPMISISENELPFNDATRKHELPKGWHFDTNVIAKGQVADDINKRIFRDIPEVKFEQYMANIWELCKVVNYKIGQSYLTALLDAVGANQSGEALIQRENATIVMRANKISLWEKGLRHQNRLNLIFQDIIDNINKLKIAESGMTYQVSETYEDVDFQVRFPEYKEQTLKEKIELYDKMLQAGLITHKEAMKKVWGVDYNEEQIDEMVTIAKIEQGMTLIQEDVPQQAQGNEDNAV